VKNLRVEVCDDCALALGNWDEFLTCTFDDGKRDVFLRHLKTVSIYCELANVGASTYF
jgi:hypothetical protein